MIKPEFEIYSCTECSYITSAKPEGAIGTAHAHAEKHASWWKLPAWLSLVADPEKLDQYIEKIRVTDWQKIQEEEVEAE